ncbi:MAG TPA: hypothetical protein VNO55_16510 [Polyangia bacterium]|nr:hypothetical protein [Polyangia bacterium]
MPMPSSMKRTLLAATVAAGLSPFWSGVTHAQTPGPSPQPPAPGGATVTPPPPAPPSAEAAPPAMPPPTVATPMTEAPQDALPSPTAGSPTLVRNQNEYQRPSDLSYGAAMRFRWVTVPAFMLNVFTKKNVPLGFTAFPGAWAVEAFRRKGNFDVALALGYQSMSPPDGNWLGTGKDPALDTDFVQFRGLGFISVDVSFIWHTMFTDWIGMHYGAGIGVGFRHGKILRTSDSGCTDTNLGDLTKCHPSGVICTSDSCNEAQLVAQQGKGNDIPGDPHRFSDPDVPPAIPIINAVVGVDFRVPSLRGWEAKIEGGFYDAFFLGGGIAYTF